MPFKSRAQQKLFYAARKDPVLREKMDINLSAVEEMIKKDSSKAYRKKKRYAEKGY